MEKEDNQTLKDIGKGEWKGKIQRSLRKGDKKKKEAKYFHLHTEQVTC